MATSAGFFLSPQQKYIWTSAASARSQLAVLIDGAFDEPHLKAAFLEAVSANDALRTVFQRQTGMKLPFQVVPDTSAPVWTPITAAGTAGDLALAIQNSAEQEAKASASSEEAQLRSALFKVSATQTLWVITAHSSIADASSLQLLLAQTLASYSGEKVAAAEDSIRYVQFAQWQNDQLTTDPDATKFWERAAQADAEPTFPNEKVSDSTSLTQARLKIDLADQPDNDALLAAWATVIARWSSQQRVEIGVTLEGREYEELSSLIGAVSKTVPLIASMEGQPSFRELSTHIHSQLEEISSIQEYYSPEKSFKVGYEYITLAKPVTISGAAFSPVYLHDAAHDCTLKLTAVFTQDNLQLELQYRSDSIADSVATGIAASLESFLSAALASPQQAVTRLPLISATKKQQLVSDWNSTKAETPTDPIHALISAQASRNGASIAVRSGSTSLTYAELESRSNRLAQYLSQHGVKRGTLVGLCVSRSAEMLIPVLAILKAGGAFVPLSADQPKTRIAQQLSGLGALVIEGQYADQLPTFSGPTITLDTDPWQQQPDTAPAVDVTGDDLAYVIYTSGSTGTPKGVGVRHRNLVNYATHIVRALQLDAGPLQYATVSTLAADLGNTVIYPALLTGGTLHVLPYEVATDPRQMAAYQQQYSIDVLKIVPSHLAALLDGAGTDVLPKKFLITGGEALKPALVERLEGTCEIINHYGPTETTVGSLMLPLKNFDYKNSTAATIPIGKPIANTRVYVLDANRELLPIGVAGELYISGAGVTAGYIGQPEMTAERFVADPFHPNETMYRTGDLVRWLPEGLIEFLGRADDQVKIRGFRVELGEIESILAAQPGVRQCTVIARANGDDQQVVAYAVLDRQQATTTDALKQALKDRLPDYMVPTAIVELAKIPLTPNGKIDRKALPAPEERSTKEYKAPATVTEELVAQIWAEVLKLDKISADENFFDLGGHSLLATQVVSRVRENFSVEVPLRVMFESPVLHSFASAIDAEKAKGLSSTSSGPIKRAVRTAYRPTSAT